MAGCGTSTAIRDASPTSMSRPTSSPMKSRANGPRPIRKLAKWRPTSGRSRATTGFTTMSISTPSFSAEWDKNGLYWKVTTNAVTYHARFLILCTGFLEQLKFPELGGTEKFKGRLFHSVHWPEGYTGEGDRIAVLGTSASGVQIVPEMQKVADHVFVFQRTPMHLLPLNREVYSPDELARRRSDPDFLVKERDEKLAMFDKVAYDALFNSETPQQVAERQALIDAHRERLVPDPDLREKLTPKYLLGCKRPTRTDLFYPSLQQPNVTLIAEGAVALEEDTIISSSGQAFEVDAVVMATGFYWGGDILNRIRRRDGRTVAEHQAGHRRAHKSVSLSGCPNLFLVGGAAPTAPSGTAMLRVNWYPNISSPCSTI
ncbi:flavin-containing monooxygenase [Rhizorhabdus histidinilytica]